MIIEFTKIILIYLPAWDKDMDRNRIIQKTLDYWQSKLKGSRLPSRSDILPGELYDLLPFLFLADIRTLTPLGCEINLRLAGTHIERTLGVNLTGCPVGGFAKHWRDFAVGRDLFDAVNQRCAIVATHEIWGPETPAKAPFQQDKQAFLRYHRLVLPLSQDGQRVDRLIGALVTDEHRNSETLWRSPFVFEELAKKRLARPFLTARSTSITPRARPVPA